VRNKITIEAIVPQRFYVLRDDLLPGGTKSVLLPHLIPKGVREIIYASPVYGGFQIAIAQYARAHGLRAHIFCAARKKLHPNTIAAREAGAMIRQVPVGYLAVVEAAARKYAERLPGGRYKLAFGGREGEARAILADRVRAVMKRLPREPETIHCAVGSGLLAEAILEGTTYAQVVGTMVGREYSNAHPRFRLIRYPKPFEAASNYDAPFPSMPNYDRKSWEVANKTRINTQLTLFWNVL